MIYIPQHRFDNDQNRNPQRAEIVFYQKIFGNRRSNTADAFQYRNLMTFDTGFCAGDHFIRFQRNALQLARLCRSQRCFQHNRDHLFAQCVRISRALHLELGVCGNQFTILSPYAAGRYRFKDARRNAAIPQRRCQRARYHRLSHFRIRCRNTYCNQSACLLSEINVPFHPAKQQIRFPFLAANLLLQRSSLHHLSAAQQFLLLQTACCTVSSFFRNGCSMTAQSSVNRNLVKVYESNYKTFLFVSQPSISYKLTVIAKKRTAVTHSCLMAVLVIYHSMIQIAVRSKRVPILQNTSYSTVHRQEPFQSPAPRRHHHWMPSRSSPRSAPPFSHWPPLPRSRHFESCSGHCYCPRCT